MAKSKGKSKEKSKEKSKGKDKAKHAKAVKRYKASLKKLNAELKKVEKLEKKAFQPASGQLPLATSDATNVSLFATGAVAPLMRVTSVVAHSIIR